MLAFLPEMGNTRVFATAAGFSFVVCDDVKKNRTDSPRTRVKFFIGVKVYK
jgi:hypothetical protein